MVFFWGFFLGFFVYEVGICMGFSKMFFFFYLAVVKEFKFVLQACFCLFFIVVYHVAEWPENGNVLPVLMKLYRRSVQTGLRSLNRKLRQKKKILKNWGTLFVTCVLTYRWDLLHLNKSYLNNIFLFH